MRTVGEILGQRRKALNFTLEQVEKETKIRQKYLESIEKNNFSLIPESTVVKGFIRNYALFLGLSPNDLLAVLRRDFLENEKGQIIPRGAVEPLDERRFGFYWTPKLTAFSIATLLLAAFIILFVKQYLVFSSPPPLEIFSPVVGQKFAEKVLVSGKTDKNATVKIDGNLVSIDNEGVFTEEVVLPRGENIINIEVSNRQLKKRNKRIAVTIE